MRGNPFEMRRLRGRRTLTDRTLHVECPNYPDVDARSAEAVAKMAISDAVIGGCGKILVKGPKWKYEFDTNALNDKVGTKTFGGRIPARVGMMFQNPLEKVVAGSFYDETKALWTVPRSYNVREKTIVDPTP